MVVSLARNSVFTPFSVKVLVMLCKYLSCLVTKFTSKTWYSARKALATPTNETVTNNFVVTQVLFICCSGESNNLKSVKKTNSSKYFSKPGWREVGGRVKAYRRKLLQDRKDFVRKNRILFRSNHKKRRLRPIFCVTNMLDKHKYFFIEVFTI